MNQQNPGMTGGSEPAPSMHSPKFERTMKIVVTVLGLMMLAGLATVVARIIYLANSPQRQAAQAAVRPAGASRLALPAQTVIKNLSLSGNRLAVQYEGPGGGGIVIVDTSTGAVISRLDIVPEVPR